MSDSTAPTASAPSPKATKATKAKAPKSPKAAKVAPSHPTYSAMIKKALVDLKERNGSSRTAISKYLTSHYKLGDSSNQVTPAVVRLTKALQINARLRAALKKGLLKGELQQTKGNGASGSFKLVKAAPAFPAAPAAKKPRAKKEPTAKKAAPKKEKKAASPKKAKAAKPKTTKPKSPKKAKTVKKATKPKSPKAKKTTAKA